MKNIKQKGFSMPIVIVAAAVLVLAVGGIYFFYANQQPTIEKENLMMEKKDDAVMEKKEDSMMEKKEGEMMGKKEGENTEGGLMWYAGPILAGDSAPLIDFVKSDYDKALASDKLIVLYFYANWCPICKVEVANALYPAFDGLTTDKVIGFRVHYNDNQTGDDEKDLARQFGVAYQHTKVFVKNGQRILKSPESWDKSRYETEITKALTE